MVQNFLGRFPEVEKALRAAKITLVVFQPDDAHEEEEDPRFAARVQAALDQVSLPEGVGEPLFLCECHASKLRSLWSRASPPAPSHPLLEIRSGVGSFEGYLGLG